MTSLIQDLETHYNHVMRLYSIADEHRWSRRMTQRDADAVNELRKELLDLANGLYRLRQEIGGAGGKRNTTDKLAAADALADVAEYLSSSALIGGDSGYLTIDRHDLAELDAAIRRYRGGERCLACAAGDPELGPQHDENCPRHVPF